jgi:hypothetical protein
MTTEMEIDQITESQIAWHCAQIAMRLKHVPAEASNFVICRFQLSNSRWSYIRYQIKLL